MSKSTATDRVFDGIVADILAGVIRPRDRISERDLVSRFGVSRTPVREATKRLFERGFITPGPKGVAVVAEIGAEDLKKLYDMRLQLEEAAALETVNNITAAEIQELSRINKLFADALEKRDLIAMLEVRAEFHAVLTGATRNRWMEMVLTMLRDRAYVVRHYHWQDIDRAAQTLHYHELMIAALKRRDGPGYQQLVVQQIRSAFDSYHSRLRAPEAELRPVRKTRQPVAEA